jgi:hypothetical protein
MGTELITIKSLASQFGLTFGPISTSSIGIKLPLKTKLLKCIENEINTMKGRDTTELIFKKDKIREIRFHRLVDGNELEVCVKYKGKKHGVDPNGEGGIKCKNDINSLRTTLNGIYELYKSIPEDNEFYAEDKK